MMKFLPLLIVLSLLVACTTRELSNPQPGADSSDTLAAAFPAGEQACAALAGSMQGRWPDSSTTVTEVHWVEAGTPVMLDRSPRPIELPAHCEVIAAMQQREGVDGQHYAIKFHLRLPLDWNGRFFFQGGAGSNGNLGSAIGVITFNGPSALDQGYAVVSQDSGHDNAVNTVPERNGPLAFGFDPEARANYGGRSLEPVAEAAQAVIDTYFGRAADFSYFVGCSKGGQEGMMFAQRYPQFFDGIVAAAPGFSLPRAAVAEIWDLQAFGRIDAKPGDDGIDLGRLSTSFSDEQLALVRDAVLEVCDAEDGVRDGLTSNFEACTTPAVAEALTRRLCSAASSASACLQPAQIEALQTVYAGPEDSSGTALYSDWAWDGGIGSDGWRSWKIGSADGKVPSLNFVLGAVATAAVITTPPTEVANLPDAIADYAEHFDFDRDAARIYAEQAPFERSAWEDIGARSPELGAFRDQGGKLIVPHGVSDPVFSINDTAAWYKEVDERNHGGADRFVRVFPVPGMAHCGGGPTVDLYNAFDALVAWVEEGHAPDMILATASPRSPWPGRTRPLCPYPKYARYKGEGSIEDAGSFVCASPIQAIQ